MLTSLRFTLRTWPGSYKFSTVAKEKGWFDQLSIGKTKIPNRICLAAMTRQRCDPKTGVPTDLVSEQYWQRADAGLLLTEAAAISKQGEAFPGNANMYNKDHVEGYRKVIERVAEKGGKFYCQLVHTGRSTSKQLNWGQDVLAPSAIANREMNFFTQSNYPVPKEMSQKDIKQVIQEFKHSAQLAKEAGFEGIQLHGANGYLITQFLNSFSNVRKDNYGGSPENRCRFVLEVLDACAEVFSPSQIGIKLSPVVRQNDSFDENPIETYGYLIKELDKRQIGFIELRESTEQVSQKRHKDPQEQIPNVCKAFRPYYKGIIIANGEFSPESGLKKIRSGDADMVSFGRWYLGNPDLVNRIKHGYPINQKLDMRTFYTPGPKGYIDYPTYEEQQKQNAAQQN